MKSEEIKLLQIIDMQENQLQNSINKIGYVTLDFKNNLIDKLTYSLKEICRLETDEDY